MSRSPWSSGVSAEKVDTREGELSCATAAFADGGKGFIGWARMLFVPVRMGLAKQIQRVKNWMLRWPVMNCLPPDNNV
jgi:hypothetical protein